MGLWSQWSPRGERDYTQLSATFNTVINYIYAELSYLVANNFNFFIPWLPYFKEKIQQKIADSSNGVIPAELADVGLFLDGTFQECSRPSDNAIQTAKYSGHHKVTLF